MKKSKAGLIENKIKWYIFKEVDMTTKIIAALFLVAFFFILTKVASGMLGKDHALSKVFPIGSAILVTFFLGLMFLE